MAKFKHIPEELSAYRVTGNNIDELLNKIIRKEKDPELLVIDLFCGAGGTSTGFANTDGRALVIACVNHDKNAINSHWENAGGSATYGYQNNG